MKNRFLLHLKPVGQLSKETLDAIADKVLAYRAVARTKKAKKRARKRRAQCKSSI